MGAGAYAPVGSIDINVSGLGLPAAGAGVRGISGGGGSSGGGGGSGGGGSGGAAER
jgi:hypothetical protein